MYTLTDSMNLACIGRRRGLVNVRRKNVKDSEHNKRQKKQQGERFRRLCPFQSVPKLCSIQNRFSTPRNHIELSMYQWTNWLNLFKNRYFPQVFIQNV